jgi:NAD(P)-dependent dehydrogenase (short-subunit alcohol dehydrogenase family)
MMTVGLDLFSLKDKVALVTGAGSGIGKGLSLGFANAGADVALVDINPETVDAVGSEVRKIGRQALTIAADVTKSEAIDKLINQIVDKLGRINIVANVAGGLSTAQRGTALDLSEESWDSVVTLNLKSVFLLSAAAARVMISRKIQGSMINIGSIAGLTSYPGASHYGAAKAGVMHLTKSLAADWGRVGIRVNAIAPGVVDTPLFRQAETFFRVEREKLVEKIPLGRLGLPEDIAAVAIFLASDASAYVTGQTIVVNGGLEYFG